ncbi:CASP8 and FADD-like apoptosis regulator isoform X2 [Paralichthys olivaceus]|uniref:CASP8 and FADD-like apoptosis regulator isoform X2 n=1 Tax=Paralichthys olivaceus TaxID=8255 RepID=UPI00097D1C49|nr:PREDICTED: CASP8 and FADD-like apoptosis regulator isoform X2 [Paralichthys olivaceus]
MAVTDQRELQVISQIAEALSSSERRSLFYLCESPQTDDSTACAKEMLKNKVICQDGGQLFLAELLSQLRRFDILRRVCRISKEEVESIPKCQQVLPRFRVLMAHISEDLAHEDLDNVKFLMGSMLPRETMEKAKNFLDVIIELEKQDQVSPERVDIVEKCLINIGRVDLAKKVTKYKMSVGAPEERSSQQEQCRAPCTHVTPPSSHSLQQTRQGQSLQAENTPAPVYIQQSSQSLLDRYKFNSNPRGVCVIIDCVGNDGDMLEQTFKALHFKVVLHKWLSVDNTFSTLRDISQERENLKGDAFVCCIISRGTANHLLGVDMHRTGLRLDRVRRLFTSDACAMMAGKPKLFFIQTYKGPEFQPYAARHHQDEDLEPDGCHGLPGYDFIPTDADVFWSHCWTDERQLEQRHHRSIYLKTLTDTLLKGQNRKKIVDMHTEVNGAIFDHNRRNPAASYHIDLKHTLRKDLYLQ